MRVTPGMVGEVLDASSPLTGLPTDVQRAAGEAALKSDSLTDMTPPVLALLAAWKMKRHIEDSSAAHYWAWLTSDGGVVKNRIVSFLVEVCNLLGHPAWLVSALSDLGHNHGLTLPKSTGKCRVTGYHRPGKKGVYE